MGGKEGRLIVAEREGGVGYEVALNVGGQGGKDDGDVVVKEGFQFKFQKPGIEDGGAHATDCRRLGCG